MKLPEEWSAFIAGLRRSKTIFFSCLLAGLGSLMDQRGQLEPLLQTHGTLVFSAIAVAVAVLRIYTTQSIAEKGQPK